MEEKIIEFLNRKDTYRLPPLDDEKRLALYDTSVHEGYTGVTTLFIHKYVLNSKYSYKELVEKLIELLDNKVIRALYCGNVSDIVFENGVFQTNHWTYEKGVNRKFSIKTGYDYFIKRMNDKIIDHD